jgi:hypothetical protein
MILSKVIISGFLFGFVTMCAVLIKGELKAYKAYKIWHYKFFLKLLRDAKKDKNLDESLHRFSALMPKFKYNFDLYYGRKNKREWKARFKELNSIVREILSKNPKKLEPLK